MQDFEWLEANAERIALSLTNSHFGEGAPAHQRQAYARDKCLEDARFHIHHLAEALRANSEKLFVEYIGWVKVVLNSRNVGEQDLHEHLERFSNVLGDEAPADCARRPLEFVRSAMSALPSLPATTVSYIDIGQPYSELANSYLQMLLRLDLRAAVDSLVSEVQEKGLSISDLFEHVISPTQREVGRLWQNNSVSVLQEHYCTAATELVLTRLSRSFAGNWRQVRALTLCAAGEQHCIGLKMLSELLEADGWTVSYIGQNTPARDVVDFLRRFPTDVIAISVGTALNMPSTRSLVRTIRTADLPHPPRILVGGAALLNADLWQTLEADAWAPTVSDGLDAANRLVA
jgi:methanogenic corrinoid protein MtbC1